MWVEDSKLNVTISAAESALDTAQARPLPTAPEAEHNAAIDKYIPIADAAKDALAAEVADIDTNFAAQWTTLVVAKKTEREDAYNDAPTKMQAVTDFIGTKDAVIVALTNAFNPVDSRDYSMEGDKAVLNAAKGVLDGLILQIDRAKQQLADNHDQAVAALQAVVDLAQYPYAVATSDQNGRICDAICLCRQCGRTNYRPISQGRSGSKASNTRH